MDDLHRLVIDDSESRSQDFVTRNQLVDHAFHHGRIERALDAAGAENVISSVAGLQLFDEPQSLLIDRGWKQVRVVARPPRDLVHLWRTQSFRLQRRFKHGALLGIERCYPCRKIFHKTFFPEPEPTANEAVLAAGA